MSIIIFFSSVGVSSRRHHGGDPPHLDPASRPETSVPYLIKKRIGREVLLSTTKPRHERRPRPCGTIKLLLLLGNILLHNDLLE
jgi:hypothetical protein